MIIMNFALYFLNEIHGTAMGIPLVEFTNSYEILNRKSFLLSAPCSLLFQWPIIPTHCFIPFDLRFEPFFEIFQIFHFFWGPG